MYAPGPRLRRAIHDRTAFLADGRFLLYSQNERWSSLNVAQCDQ